MNVENIEKHLSLIKFLTYNIVQIRSLCKKLYDETSQDSIEAHQQVFLYIDASYKKTQSDEKSILLILKAIQKELNTWDDVEIDVNKIKFIQSFQSLRGDVLKQLEESSFNY